MKVSVLINNYNYGRFLEDCFDSLRNQTVKPDEVIFYDDGSSDNSVEIARKYNFVKVLSFPNFGKRPAFNQGNAINSAFAVSTGDIICLLDSDDFFERTKIEKIRHSFLENPNAVCVQHAYLEYVNGKVTREVDFSIKGVQYKSLYYKRNWTAFFNPTSTLSFRRSYLQKVLPIHPDDQWRVWPDVRISRIAPFYGNIICLSDTLTYYRRHGNNDSGMMNKRGWNTFVNQVSHHGYINNSISLLGEKKIPFYFSKNYFKFLLKIVIPVSKLKRNV